MDFKAVNAVNQAVKSRVGRVIVGKEGVTELLVISLLCGGHILIDDVPGTGKTMLARTFADALSLDFKRVQCVPDMLPSDLMGVNIFDMKQSEFRFVSGPVFTNILLADEINRAMPKTQSGLLECMEEHQVSIDGTTYALPEPFMVIATQNPIETKGTFELPEAQLDRFLIKTSMGYPTREDDIEILQRKLSRRSEDDSSLPRITAEIIEMARREVESVHVHRDIMSYASEICEATRKDKSVILGASPRAMIALVYVARALAAINGRDHVLPDDIKSVAVPVLAHRMVFTNSFLHRDNLGAELIQKVLDSVPVPSERIDFSRR